MRNRKHFFAVEVDDYFLWAIRTIVEWGIPRWLTALANEIWVDREYSNLFFH
jgi:hypothetical protein